MRINRLSCAIGALLLAGASVQAVADVTANIGAVSNYMWRGVSQTDDGAAIQGGVDFSHDSGFYAGTWVSNVDFGGDTGTEMDLYLGIGGEVEEVNWDLNAIYYAYPDLDDSDFWEIGGSLGYSVATVGVQYTVDGEPDNIEGATYYYVNLSFDLPEDFGVGATLGKYDFDEDFAEDYTHWQLSLSKDAGDWGSFSLNYDKTDMDESDPKVWVGWSKEF